MSRRKRRKEAPLPASSAGLLRFFEDESLGIKIRPEAVLMLSLLLILFSILLLIFF